MASGSQTTTSPSATNPTTTLPFFHVCILVADIEDAVERFSAAFDMTFAPILTSDMEFHGASNERYALRWVFSRQGPPYIELIEGQGDGLFSLAAGERLHHIGRWAPSDQIDALKTRFGAAVTVTRPGFAGTGLWFADPALFYGIWIELVDEGFRPVLDSLRSETDTWLASG
jgi:hypothetical protein